MQKNQSKRFIKINRRIIDRHPVFCAKVKLAYNKWSHVRWTHTTAIPAKIWHPMTAFFAKNAIDYAVIINNSWTHFKTFEKMRSKINYHEILYKNFDNPFKNKIKIATMMEHNLLTNFSALKERNIKLFSYNKNVKTDTYNQSQDDIQFDPLEAIPPILDLRTHALDQKSTPYAASIPEPSSKILSSISPMEYQQVLRNFRQSLLNNVDISYVQLMQIDIALDQLFDSCENLNLHQVYWIECLHFFPNNFIPPLRIPNNFCIENLLPEIQNIFYNRLAYFENISHVLYEKNIPCDYEQAIEILDNSFIQTILDSVN